MITTNLLLDTDSYKYTHWKQYPPGTQKVYSYLESRGGQFPYTVFFGLLPILQRLAKGISTNDTYEASYLAAAHFGNAELFNVSGWYDVVNKHNGKLPLEIKAVPEGTVVPVGNVLMTIENTDPEFPWLTNFFETMALRVWYPTTVATQSRAIKEIILAYLEKTGDPSLISFKLHDFGCRGVSSLESAAIGGAAHLVNFMGTDTIPAIKLVQDVYNGGMPGFSIPASEHSTMTSWGREHEADAMKNMLDSYPEGLVACVSDSFDIENACRYIWGALLRDQIRNRKGTLVVRPDSGDPVTIVLQCLEILGERFGIETNEKGYKVLPPCIRLIQGDGVNYHSINAILRTMEERGWSADNVAFGMGGALLQQLNRDTQKFAFKCSNITINGQDQDVWKEPKTDAGKNSKRGRLALHNIDGNWSTTKKVNGVGDPYDLLETVFLNGEILTHDTFDKIRERAAI
jgi:nicotinamide phosphoribosyltransferase